MHSNFRVLFLLAGHALIAFAQDISFDEEGDAHHRTRIMRKAPTGAAALEISGGGKMHSSGGFASTGPTGACCMKEVLEYMDYPATQGNTSADPDLQRAKIVFMCRDGNCPAAWTPVSGSHCDLGFAEGLEAGLSANDGAGFGYTGVGTDRHAASCHVATAGTAGADADDDAGADADVSTLPSIVCCGKLDTSNARTKVKFECKTKGCGSTWQEVHGAHCQQAFTIGKDASVGSTQFSLHEKAFCQGFDGQTNHLVGGR